MNAANRKTKYSRYSVTVTRHLEHYQTLEVTARSVEEAQDIAKNCVDDSIHQRDWREGDIISETAKAKKIGDAV